MKPSSLFVSLFMGLSLTAVRPATLHEPGTTRVNFSDTGDFNVTFLDDAVTAEIIPPPSPPGTERLDAVRNGNTLQISWTGGPGIRLQRLSSLADSGWTDVNGSDGRSSASVPISGATEFFRVLGP